MFSQDIMYWGHKHIIDSLKEIKEKDWNKIGVTSRWSTKDLVAHLVSYEYLLVDAFRYVLKLNMDRPYLDAMNEGPEMFNDAQVTVRTSKSKTYVLREYNVAHQEAVKLMKKIGPRLLAKPGTIPWYGKQYSLDDFIVYANYGHSEAHVTHLKTFAAKMKNKKIMSS